MLVLKKNPYGLNTRMVQLVLDRTSILIRSRPYAYGPNTRMVWNIYMIYSQSYYERNTGKNKNNTSKKQNKQKTKTNKQAKNKNNNNNKTPKQSKIKRLTIYESLKLVCTCKLSIYLLVFIRVISLTT